MSIPPIFPLLNLHIIIKLGLYMNSPHCGKTLNCQMCTTSTTMALKLEKRTSKVGTWACQHARHIGTWVCKHTRHAGMWARKHTRHVRTWACHHATHCGKWLCKHARYIGMSAREQKNISKTQWIWFYFWVFCFELIHFHTICIKKIVASIAVQTSKKIPFLIL